MALLLIGGYIGWQQYQQSVGRAEAEAEHLAELLKQQQEATGYYIVSAALKLRTVERAGAAKGFYFPRKTYYLGRWIQHGGWYPNHITRIVDRRAGQWSEPAVHESLQISGEVRGLRHALNHYTFSEIRDQILTNLNFSRLGYLELKNKGQRASVVRLLLKPLGKFFETYLLKRGFLDGLPGLIISINAAHSMFLKYAYLIEGEIQSEHPHHR
jgi:hypothetical protein